MECTQQRKLVCGHRTCANMDTFLRYLESTNVNRTVTIPDYLFQEYDPSTYGKKTAEWVHDCVKQLNYILSPIYMA